MPRLPRHRLSARAPALQDGRAGGAGGGPWGEGTLPRSMLLAPPHRLAHRLRPKTIPFNAADIAGPQGAHALSDADSALMQRFHASLSSHAPAPLHRPRPRSAHQKSPCRKSGIIILSKGNHRPEARILFMSPWGSGNMVSIASHHSC